MSTPSWFDELCSTTFMPHGQCYLWNADLLWLHGISDSLICLAYFSIPLTLFYFVRKRRDLPYPALFLLFGGFIVACGTTHLMEVVTIWHPYYWISGSIKAATAAISLVTAVGLVRVVPQALALPSPEDLRQLNLALEDKVQLRTADLSKANGDLRREIAQRQEAENEVRRLNASLQLRLDEMRTLFDLLPVGVGIATDASGRDIRANRALSRMLAQTETANVSLTAAPEEAPRNFRVFIGGQETPPENLPIQVALRENRPVVDVEETIEHDDGTKVIALASAVPLHDEHGRCRGCVATFQDITAFKAMDRKFQDMQRLESLGVLAGGIAHDFNNLLTVVLGNASLIRRDLPAASAHRPNIEQIELAGQRAADLCQQMLAYSGKGRFIVQPLDLNQLIKDVTPLLNISISKNCLIYFKLAPTMPAVVADATQLRQIVMNLVINASEAVGSGSGIISVTTGVMHAGPDYLATLRHGPEISPGDFVWLEISDNGSGMEPATLEKIFDPFFTTKFTGRGLGLAAVLGIIRGHKGALRVDSRPGHGTTFKILLPYAEPVAATPPPAPRTGEPRRVGQGTVLVVDDEDSVRAISTVILQSLGYTVVMASGGHAALDIFRRDPKRFALVLLDLTMPEMNGEETFHQLRQLNPDVQVVLMSGYNQQDAISHFTGKGLAGFVQKPFTYESILAVLREVASGA